MKHFLSHLPLQVRAICILLTLFMVPNIVHADDVYLLTAETINGATGNYNVPSNHQFTNTSGTEYTYTINTIPTGGTFYFRIGVKGRNENFQPYQNNDALVINGSSYTISENCNGNDKAWKVSYTDGEYSSLTITVDLSSSNRYVKITGVKSSAGGGSSTNANQPGLYLYGSNFGNSDPNKHLTYKFLRKNDSEYHFAVYAGDMPFSVQQYKHNGNVNITPSCNGFAFNIAYIDADGKTSTYSPSSNYTLTGTDGTASSPKEFGSNAQWTIQDNGGIYDLVVKVDADGKPASWYYESDPNRIVAYKASSSSNWTTEAFLYCVRNTSDATTAYCKNFFGTVPMVKDEQFKFIVGNYWFGQTTNEQQPYGQNPAISGTEDAPNLVNPYDGIYRVEFNPDRDYMLSDHNDKTPLRIFMIGSALNSNLTHAFADWSPTNAVELVYDKDEQCYKGTVSLAKGGQFRFLRDTNASGPATSRELNFGEDGNTPGQGGDTDFDNHVKYNANSTTGENVEFNPETDTYNVRFYIEAGTKMEGFTWEGAKFRYTIEKPARLNVVLTPPTATVPFAASLTPKVAVVGTQSKERTYAYTLDGSAPTIEAATGKGKNTTKVATYTCDEVIPTNDLTTFYMNSDNVLTYIDGDGMAQTLTGNSVVVKVQAVQTITEGSSYRLEGDVATGSYTFDKVVTQPTADYTISVTNDNTGSAPSVNKATATVSVTNTTTGEEDKDVDVYYTTDNSDPATSTSARLVRHRMITVYEPHLAGGMIRVAIAGSKAIEEAKDDDNKTHAHCDYDITYSTSEGGYQNFRTGDRTQKTLGGEGHVVVYVKPYSSDNNITVADGKNDSGRTPFICAYERVKSDDGYVSKFLTHPHHQLHVDESQTPIGQETGWLYVDLDPTEGYKDVNVMLGYTDDDGATYKMTEATVANACKDMFLKFDVATGQITDVTHEYTNDYFYTTGEGGTKKEKANPAADEAFFYVQVPSEWTSNGNSVRVLKDEAVYDGAEVSVQPAAQTSESSNVCKVVLSAPLEENTLLTIKPYKGNVASNLKFDIIYQNGGYYFYESDKHNSKVAPLVFAQDKSGDTDQRDYGKRDFNHLLEVYNGDYTNYLSKEWRSTSSEAKTVEADNWTGKKATVDVLPAGATLSQTVEGLTPGLFTVQMIVRGKSGAKGTLKLKGSTYTDESGAVSSTPAEASDNKAFAGYDAQGTVTTDGRVEALLSTDTKNGWQKLEATAAVGDEGTLDISLTAEGDELQLSDVTLLWNANQEGSVWTKAPTNDQMTEFDLTDRSKANSFSFFDRGANKNAVVYVNAKTVLGMSKNTYNVAVAVPIEDSGKPAGVPRKGEGHGGGPSTPVTLSGEKLVLTDNVGSWTSDHTWYATIGVTWNSFSYDRKFLGRSNSEGTRNTICLPFAMNEDMIKSMFGKEAKVYTITSIDEANMSVNANPVAVTEANKPYVLELADDLSGISTTKTVFTEKTPDEASLAIGENGDIFVGVFQYTNIKTREDDKFRYYGYDGENNGVFNFFSKEGADFKPFRAYLEIAKTSKPAKAFYYFNVENGSATGITNTEAEERYSNDAPVYNLQGQMVRRQGEKTMLPSGIYVQNGRKFIQK